MTALNSPPEDTLYRRLRGYDVIAGVIDEFLNLLQSDPGFARFGAGRSLDSCQRTRRLIVEQIWSLAAGPSVYTGRDMKTSHAGLGITEAEWQTDIHTLCWVGKIRRSSQGEGRVFGNFSEVQGRYRREVLKPHREPCRGARETFDKLLTHARASLHV